MIGWICDLPRLAASTQRAALLAAGVAERDIIADGATMSSRRRQDWSWLMRKLRAGDTLAVAKLRAIYEPQGKLSPRRALFHRLHDVEDRGCHIIEISTGRRSTIARERDMMVSDCLDQLTRSAQGRDGGRPRLELSPAEIAVVERHWPSSRHATNQAAVAAIRVEAQAAGMTELLRMRSVQAFLNRFGASGRGRLAVQPGRKPKR